ncbi:transmembrane protein 26-like [Pelodytes ibericus]
MLYKIRKMLWAVVSRALFIAHGVLLVWRVVEVKKNTYYWMLLIGLLLLAVEMALTLSVTKKGEWKWFCPMVFLYLCSTIPSIFILELDLVQVKTLMNNSTENEGSIAQVFHFTQPSQWLDTLEQIMILIIVLGRWLMPKGEMNRDQLTQLLLIYIGLGADILDILQLIRAPGLEANWTIAIVGLSLFSWALLQFTLVLTQCSQTDGEDDCEEPQSTAVVKPARGSLCGSSEVWSLVIAVAMQDGPFLVFRLYLAFKEKVVNVMMIFFICKNVITVIIEIYRIGIVHIT